MAELPVRVHRVNDWLCFFLGYLFNGALLWLIANRTTSVMEKYRPILLLSTVVDFVYLAVFALVVPVLVVDGGLGIWVSVGPLRWVPLPYAYALIALWTLCASFSVYSLFVPFIFRYMCICRVKKWGLRAFLRMLLLPLIGSLSVLAVQIYAGYPRSAEHQQRGREFLFNANIGVNSTTSTINATLTEQSANQEDYVIAYFSVDREHSDVLMLFVMCMLLIFYVPVFFCAWRIYRHLTRMAAGNVNAEQYRALQLQLSRVLLLQSLAPFLVEFMPGMFAHLSAFTGMDARNIAGYAIDMHAWIPVLNPLIVMWVLEAYRKSMGDFWRNLVDVVSGKRSAATVHPTTT